jgi:glycosyltransferase 2 family protein
MRELLAAAVRVIKQRVSWHAVGIVASLAIIALAGVTLVHLLRDVDVDKIFRALRETPAHNIAVAALLVAAAYGTLTFYDWFALRTIGRKDVPYRVAAFAAFTSYSIGHNIGATVFTGGAIRFRIYSAWGLTIIDVAKLAFITGLTFWLGNAFVLGLGMAYAPDAASAINQLPAWINRALALTLLTAIVLYLAWVGYRPRIIGRDGWLVRLPSARLTLVQIGIGVLDLGLSGLAMYALTPSGHEVGVVTIVVTFVLATLLAFASHAPGGLGVFDAAMLVGLSAIDKEALLASLVLFRLLYYIVPFSLALTLMGCRELWLSARAAAHARHAAPEPPQPPPAPCSGKKSPAERTP